jgi:hypothetical protein
MSEVHHGDVEPDMAFFQSAYVHVYSADKEHGGEAIGLKVHGRWLSEVWKVVGSTERPGWLDWRWDGDH